jgi:PAS domain S-box-containing protein
VIVLAGAYFAAARIGLWMIETALHEKQMQLQAILDHSPALISIKDLEGNVILVNRNFEVLDGPSPEEFLGKNVYELFPKDVADELWKNDLAAVEAGEPIEAEEVVKHKDGSSHTYLTVKFPLYGDTGRAFGTCAISTDITERKRLEQQFLETQKMQAIGTLAGGVAHQFNNALAAIFGNIDLIELDSRDDQYITRYIEPLKESSHRIAQLTNQLLAYARGSRYQPKTISLNEFVKNTLPLVKHALKSSVDIETDLPHDVPTIEADATQMQTVLSAVLANASESIEARGRVRISLRDESVSEDTSQNHPGVKPGRYVCHTVEDDGKGMDGATKSRVFEPFFTTKFQGRGLGMAAAYGIVKNHDGWISIDSATGTGTKVSIHLPAAKTAPREKERVRKREVETAKTTSTVLVIDDEETVMNVSRAMLEKLGCRVLGAKTGEEAVNLVKSHVGKIDLAILDVMLPDMAATNVYTSLKKARPDLKVVAFSGYTLDGPAQELLDAGAQGFIQKPISFATLSERLKQALG